MYASLARGIAAMASLGGAVLVVACGAENGKSDRGQQPQYAGFPNFGGFGSSPLASGGFPMTGGFGGAASSAGVVGQGGIIASGGFFSTGGIAQVGTGGVFDPGPPPTGQILDCRGTGPCRLDDGDACCIAASVNNGVVQSISENCIPPNASCEYPFTIARCDGPEDCRQSEVCCGTLRPFGNAQLFGEIECVPAGECTAGQKFVVCRQGVTACPVGTTCGTFPTLPDDILVCR
ncbi:MAG TPA: hypothetical protein VFV94_16475 [Polyangiaceae bacterium]|nr:hypothetical protein [Polyangiaceae bacterium]